MFLKVQKHFSGSKVKVKCHRNLLTSRSSVTHYSNQCQQCYDGDSDFQIRVHQKQFVGPTLLGPAGGAHSALQDPATTLAGTLERV